MEIEALVEDDYGIQKISLVSLQGEKKREINLEKFQQGSYFKSKTVKYSFSFQDEDIEKYSERGIIISYYLKANDHAMQSVQGKKREARSKIFFIQFKKDKKKKQQAQMPPSNATNEFSSFMRVTDLILRWKKNLQNLSSSWQNKNSHREIKKKFNSIDIELKKRSNEAKGNYIVNFFPNLKKEILGTYQKSVSSVSNYLAQFSVQDFDKQFFSANQTLRQLNDTDAILQKYFPANGSSQSTNQQEQNDNNQQQTLQQAKQKIADLIDKQKEIQKNIQNNKKFTQQTKEQLQQQKNNLAQLKKKLEQKVLDDKLQRQLDRANQNLNQLDSSLNNSLGNSSGEKSKNNQKKSSELASETLQNLKQAQQRIQKLANDKKFNKSSFAKKLLNDFKKIQNRQNKIFKQTKKLSFKNRKQLAKQQSQNENSFFQWSDDLSKAILSLNDKNYKEILNDLKKIKRTVGSEAVPAKMKKNKKFLQFNRKTQSLEEQKEILQKLNLLRQQIEMMARKRPKLGTKQLLAIKKKLQSSLQENRSGQQEESKSLAKLYNQMGNLAGINKKIETLYNNLSEKKRQKKNISLEEQNIILKKTIEEVDSLILKQKLNEKQFYGETTVIPKEYKKTIKSYFEKLNKN